MKKHFVFLLLVLLSLVAICPYAGIVHASSNTVPNELKGIDFSKPPSQKEQERIMDYYRKYNKEVCEKISREPNKQSSSSKKDKRTKYAVGTYGDILYAYEFCVSFLCGSIIGHAGIVSTDRRWTIESYPARGARMAHITGKARRENGVRKYENAWKKSSKVMGLRVKTAKKRHYMGAAKYAMKQAALRKSYNWNLCNKYTERKFYCSQLVWRAWKQQGYRIESVNLGKYDPVLPVELYWSPLTYVFYKK